MRLLERESAGKESGQCYLAQTVEHGGTTSGSVFLLLCPRKKPAARMLA